MTSPDISSATLATAAGHRSLRAVLLLVACAASIAFCHASVAGAAVFGTQGVSARPGVPQAELDSRVAFAARAGAKVIRIDADWAELEPTGPDVRDAAAIDALDRATATVARRGMRTLLVISGTPCWASSAPADVRGSCTGPGANRDEVTRYRPAESQTVVPISVFLAARYAKTLAAFQIWNEPDQANERYWAGPDKAATYVAMVRALYGPLKQAAPSVPVLAGSFVGKDGRWLKAMYKAGIKGFYDGLAVQFYGYTLYGLRTTRALQRANGDRKPLWLTEFGYTSCYRKGGPRVQLEQTCVTRAGAAQGLSDILTGIRGRSWIVAAIQFNLYDDGPGGYSFGLADQRGALKPAYSAVRRVLTGRTRKPKRPTIRLRARGGRVTVTGTSSLSDIVSLRVEQRGTLRVRVTLGPDRFGKWRIVLPASLGTRGLTVRATAGWTGAAVARI